MTSDFIKIPIYQGEAGSEGSRAIDNEHVYDVVISGEDLPALLPEGSDVDLTINVDKSEKITLQAYFPYQDHTASIEVPTDTVQQEIDTDWLSNELKKAKGTIKGLRSEGHQTNDEVLQKIEDDIEYLEKRFNQGKGDYDRKKEVLDNLRKALRKIDKLDQETEWPILEAKLRKEFELLEKANKDFGNEQSTQLVNQLRQQVDQAIRTKDVKVGRAVLKEVQDAYFALTFIYQLIGFVRHHSQNFGSFHWKDSTQARQLLNKAEQIISQNPTKETLHPIVIEIINLLPPEEKPGEDDSILMK